MDLIGLAAIIIGNHVTLEITATSIKRQPVTTNNLDRFGILPPFTILTVGQV